MEKINVGLIIIDTIAALFRGEDKEVNYRKRNKVFSKIIELLRGLAMKNDSALLFVNQVRFLKFNVFFHKLIQCFR